MKKHCIKAVFLLLIGISLLAVSCRKKALVVDEPHYVTFSVENLLDENVIISGSCYAKPFSITLSPKESYTYTQDLMSGSMVDDKIPVYLATSIKFVGATAGTVEYEKEDFLKKWGGDESHLVLKITESLFQSE